MKTALITGINGMDGSHLADFLLEKGYKVYGMERRSSTPNRKNTKHLEDKLIFSAVVVNSVSSNARYENPNNTFKYLTVKPTPTLFNLNALDIDDSKTIKELLLIEKL